MDARRDLKMTPLPTPEYRLPEMKEFFSFFLLTGYLFKEWGE